MKRHVLILSGLLALGVPAHAQTLLNSWENSLEGWTILEPGIWTTTGFSTTTGVTAGTYSWQLTASKGPDYGAALQGPSSTNLTAVLAKTLSISLDLDVPAGGSFGYYEQWDLVVSQPGGIGNVSVDGYSYPADANIGGATTLTWTIPASITTAIAANPSLPCSLIFQIGGGFNSSGTNTMFLDNLRANFYGPAQLWVRETWDGDLGEIFPTVTPLTNDISSVGFDPASPWVTNPRESGLIVSNSPTPTNTLLMAIRGQNEFAFAEPDTMGLPSTLNGATSGFVQDNSFDGHGGITLWSDGDFMTRLLSPNNYINFNIAGEYWRHPPPVDPHPAPSQQPLQGLLPQLGQGRDIQGRGMKEVQQAVVTGVRQAQAPDQAGDARQIRTQTQPGQDDDQPQKGGGTGAGRAERLEGAPESPPEQAGAPEGRKSA